MMKLSRMATALLPLLASACPAFAEETPALAEETIVVTANRMEQPVGAVLAPVNVVTRAEIESLQPKSIVDVLRTLPSVEISQNGGRGQLASIFVRGGGSDQVLVLIDGVRMPKSVLGGVDFNQFPINTVERIEYIRGARATVYGSEAIAGVINIITRTQRGENQHQLDVGIGSRQSRQAGWRSAVDMGDNGHLQVNAGYEETEGYNVHPLPGLNDGDKHGFEGKNAQLGYAHQFNPSWSGFLSARWYQNESQYDNSNYANPDWGTVDVHDRKNHWLEHQGYTGELKYRGERYHSRLALDYSEQDSFDYTDTLSRDEADTRNYIAQSYAHWENSMLLSEQWTVGGGVDWRREKLRKGSKSWGMAYAPVINPRDNLGIYALALWQSAPWTAELSGRSDDNDQYGRHNTWQAAAGWEFVPGYRLTAGYGTAFRAPTFTDLYSPFGPAPDLDPEESKNAEVAVEGFSYLVDWRLGAYDNRIDNMLVWNSNEWHMDNIGEARIRGIELELVFDTGPVSHQLYLDYKNPEDLENDTQLLRRARQNAKWNLNARALNVDWRVTYAYQGERTDFDGAILPGYSVWTLAAEVELTRQLTLKGKVENLLDKEYETAGGYPAAERGLFASLQYQF